MFVSGSKDSTLKVWTMKSRKMMFDLPGHADEVIYFIGILLIIMIGFQCGLEP